MFYAGEPNSIKGREYRAFDWAAAERLVDQCLQSYDLRTTAVYTDGAPDQPQVAPAPGRQLRR
jgi:hypothetical protein